MPKKVHLTIRTPEDLKSEFHILCIKNKTTMTDELIKTMEEYVKKNKDRGE